MNLCAIKYKNTTKKLNVNRINKVEIHEQKFKTINKQIKIS